ncbi:hypothetical protein [Segetibacter sp.]|uniref:hypothetical protein n=1 Tax=Segetibacter sp. TaxID=2231182 RepID=UPI002618820C|nr:hypothetical protein [Segetibacter sp.]MCW3081704.1 hypothetical protein [Segetibacter sp.]
METEIMHTVLTEVLEELKELKQQHSKLMAVVADLNNKVDDFELKLSNIQVSAPTTDLKPITSTVNEGILRLEGIIQAQPKSITRQYRLLLFPEHYASEYYRIVFGKLLFWMMVFLTATYLFSLGKQLINSNTAVRYKEAESIQYKKAWNYLYINSKKTIRVKMDNAWKKN